MSGQSLEEYEILTREIPFYLFESSLDFYGSDIPKLLGVSLDKMFCFSKNNLHQFHREVNQYTQVVSKIKKEVYSNPEKYLYLFDKLEIFNGKIGSVIKSNSLNPNELANQVGLIGEFMHDYWMYYLACTYIAYSVDDEFLAKNNYFGSKVISLKSKGYWVDLWGYFESKIYPNIPLPKNIVESLSISEINQILLGESIDLKKVQLRNSAFFYSYSEKEFLVGDDATLRFASYSKKSDSKVGFAKGLVAFKGKVKGIVKVIISKEDFSKLKEGDILVSTMTNVLFVPILPLAGAIVTDEGGVTSHAAIIAREMKKPCIIGTKNATKVLKDGDYVEVDAEEGIVRILTRA